MAAIVGAVQAGLGGQQRDAVAGRHGRRGCGSGRGGERTVVAQEAHGGGGRWLDDGGQGRCTVGRVGHVAASGRQGCCCNVTAGRLGVRARLGRGGGGGGLPVPQCGCASFTLRAKWNRGRQHATRARQPQLVNSTATAGPSRPIRPRVFCRPALSVAEGLAARFQQASPVRSVSKLDERPLLTRDASLALRWEGLPPAD